MAEEVKKAPTRSEREAAIKDKAGLVIVVMGLLADMIKDMRERLRVFETQLSENLLNNQNGKMILRG